MSKSTLTRWLAVGVLCVFCVWSFHLVTHHHDNHDAQGHQCPLCQSSIAAALPAILFIIAGFTVEAGQYSPFEIIPPLKGHLLSAANRRAPPATA